MSLNIPLKCTCGSLRGIVYDCTRENQNRGICMCDDCQAYAHYLGRAKDILDANAGTDIFPVAPAKLQILHGIENLKCVRLTDHGMYRWYAGCCKAPIANSMSSPNVPFAGVFHMMVDLSKDAANREAAIGPVRARMFGKYGIGPLPPKTSVNRPPLKFLLRATKFLLAGLFKKAYKPSPFFDSKTGKPAVDPYILTAAEREGLRKLCGPNAG